MQTFIKQKPTTQQQSQRLTNEECITAIKDVVNKGRITNAELNKFVALINDEQKLKIALSFL